MSIILNLGCGGRTSPSANIINIDFSPILLVSKYKFLKYFVIPFLSEKRLDRLNSIPKNILVHDLSKGIPFPNNSCDAVYHSHVLEHLDRDVADKFLAEQYRVLKIGGVARIVLPDFHYYCESYIDHYMACQTDRNEIECHEQYISSILEQSVRREPYGATKQNKFVRTVEKLIFGDARKRGETHQWMYDKYTIQSLCLSIGFSSVQIQSYNCSLIDNWNNYGLDIENGVSYKPNSLYIEAIK